MYRNRIFWLLLGLGIGISFSPATYAQSSAKTAKADACKPFAYDHGPVGQETWCGKCNAGGKFQAPINIKDPQPGYLPAIAFDYNPTRLIIVKNPENLKVGYEPTKGPITIAGWGKYYLAEFHFHRPSEEAIDDHRSAMVVHLVHLREPTDGRQCAIGEPRCAVVVSVLIEEGPPADDTKKLIDTLIQHFPPPFIPAAEVEINAKDLLPPNLRDYFRYDGSLTTPPCTEGVTFFVLKTPVKFSAEQIREFARRYPMPNARDIQATSSEQKIEETK